MGGLRYPYFHRTGPGARPHPRGASRACAARMGSVWG